MIYRRYRTPSLFRELDRLQREMNRLFDTASPSRLRMAPSYPAMNIWTNEEAINITAELPGVDSEDIEISVIGDTLTLTGERRSLDLEEEIRYHRRERGAGKFSRSIELPYRVETDQVEATFENGLLSIHLPRAEEDKPRKIAVKVNTEA